MTSASEARLWLAWLAKVRILIVTLLLGIELALAQFTPVAFPMRLFIDAVLLAYTISIFHLALLKFWRELRVQSALQVATDLLLVSLLIYVTGGADSSLNFLYPLVIIVASVLLPLPSLSFFTAEYWNYATSRSYRRTRQPILDYAPCRRSSLST